MENLRERLDEIAIKYNDTKKQYYKDLWYKKVKEYGTNIINRRTISFGESNKRDDGRYRVIKYDGICSACKSV